MSDLMITSVLVGASGSLNLESGPYSLEKATMEEVAVTWRKHEVDNPWVEGSFVTRAVRNNVVRPLNVWVSATNRAAYVAARDALVAVLEQLSFTWQFGLDGVTTTWRCQMADYSIRQQHEFLHAHTALISAQVPTAPTAIA